MSLFAFGSLWFWILMAAAFVCAIIATEKGSGMGATSTMVVTIALLFIFGNKVPLSGLFSYCVHHGLTVLLSVAGYILLGVCWAILKWYYFLLKKRDETLLKRETPYESPQVSAYKSSIMVWMFYWPFSILWTAIDMPVKRVYLFIYRGIAKWLQGMSDKIFAPLLEKQIKEKERAEQERETRRRQRAGIE